MEYDKRFDVDKVAEEVNTKNVLAVVQYSKDTRKMLREAEARVDWLTNEVTTLRSEVQNLTQQVGILRGEVYRGGPTA